jgi:TonB family protein
LGVVFPGRLLETTAGTTVPTLEVVRAVLDPSTRFPLDRIDPQGWAFWALALLTVAWILGVSRALARLAKEHHETRAHPGVPVDDLPQAHRAALTRALEETSIPFESLRVTGESVPPYVAGLWRPRIFVSRDLIATLDPAELRAILLHEDSHRRRRDPLRSTLQRLCAALLFFYPLTTLLLRRLQHATELVCDERVLRAGVGTETYARALARTLRFGFARSPRPLAAGVGGGSLLRLRFDRLTHPGRYSVMHSHRIILLLVVLLVAVATFLPQSLVAEKTEAEPAIEKMPTIIDSTLVRPVYPEQEKKDGAEGTVILRVIVTAEGLPDSITVDTAIEGHPAFSEAAVEAVRQWRFEPAEIEGKPAACEVKIPVKFALN